MEYIDRKTGMGADVIKEDDKAKTFMIRFEDGNTKVVSLITFNRQFKKNGEFDDDDAYIAEIMQQKKDLGIEVEPIDPSKVTIEEITCTADEDVCSDGTPYAEVGREIFEQAKAKAKTASSKRGQLITFNGKSQSLAAWAKELGRPQPVLYSRLYKLGWPVEKAFTK